MIEGSHDSLAAERARFNQVFSELNAELAKYSAMFKQGRQPGDPDTYDQALYRQALELNPQVRSLERSGDYHQAAEIAQNIVDLLRQAWIT